MIQSDEAYLLILGAVFLVVEIVYIGVLLMKNAGNEARYLFIYLNSGVTFYFYCKDNEFVETVLEVLKYCINNHSTQNVKIDFKQCKSYNSPVITGNRNEVYSENFWKSIG